MCDEFIHAGLIEDTTDVISLEFFQGLSGLNRFSAAGFVEVFGEAQHRSLRTNGRAFDYVGEFAHVTRPRVIAQAL